VTDKEQRYNIYTLTLSHIYNLAEAWSTFSLDPSASDSGLLPLKETLMAAARKKRHPQSLASELQKLLSSLIPP
jgi:hypothetical protein